MKRNPHKDDEAESIRREIIEYYLAWSILFGAMFLISAYVLLEYRQIGGSLSNIWLTPSADSAFHLRDPVVGVHSFSDLLLHLSWASSQSPYLALTPSSLPASNYPPFAHVFLLPLTFASYDFAVAIFIVLSISIIIIPISRSLLWLSKPMLIAVLVGGVVFTYPMLMIVDRGNIQGITTGFCLVGLWFFLGQKYKVAAVMIAFAAALKIYPILFMFIFLRRRKFREFFIGCGMAALLTLGALASFRGGLKSNVIGFVGGLSNFTGGTANPEVLIPRNHSLSALLSFVYLNFAFGNLDLSLALLENFVIVLVIIAAFLSIVSTRWLYINENQLILLICIVICLVPAITYGYVLSVFFMVLLHLFDERTDLSDSPKWYPHFLVMVLAALFTAKGIPIRYVFQATIGTVVNPMLMLLLAIAVFSRLPTRISSKVGKQIL